MCNIGRIICVATCMIILFALGLIAIATYKENALCNKGFRIKQELFE